VTRRRAPSVPAPIDRFVVLALVAGLLLTGCRAGTTASPAGTGGSPVGSDAAAAAATGPATSTGTTASLTHPPGASGLNVYAAAGAGMLAPAAAAARALVYVPDTLSGWVDVIDPATYRVVRGFRTSSVPQHVVPSWDLKTLWVNESGGNRLTPINPASGVPGRPLPVADPYNLYFTPDGRHAMVMAERLRRIDYRDPRTMALQHSLPVPCRGVNHADFTADLSTFVARCEYSGKLLVIPADGSRVAQVIDLNRVKTPGALLPAVARRRGGPAASLDPGASAMPQDVRLTPDGTTFLAADILRNGVWLLDAHTFSVRGFLHTGAGAHGIYPSRDATAIYVTDRDAGQISVVDATTLKVRARWVIPGGGSPDMGGVSADGRQLWVSGRSNAAVYVIDTRTGKLLHKIAVHPGPHGLCIWPQPGRYSLGHTGDMR
jgi:YVTN family beta-propeller protein